MSRIFIIEDVFSLKECGTVVWGYVEDLQKVRIKIGDTVTVRKVNSGVFPVNVKGIAIKSSARGDMDILLDTSSQDFDVCKGDELWMNSSTV